MNQANRSNRISLQIQADGSMDIVVPAEMAEEFKLMVKRGTNTYPSKHVEIMDFADRITGLDCAGACMKQEIYGYPKYPEAGSIVSTHWDIPAEDKYDLATDSPLITPPNFVGNE